MKSKYIHVLEVNIMVYSSRIVLTYCVMYSYMYRAFLSTASMAIILANLSVTNTLLNLQSKHSQMWWIQNMYCTYNTNYSQKKILSDWTCATITHHRCPLAKSAPLISIENTPQGRLLQIISVFSPNRHHTTPRAKPCVQGALFWKKRTFN